MIEVEKKFIPTSEEIERVIQGADLLEEETHTNVYYDTENYELTTKVRWLRNRGGKFELKIPLNWKPNNHGVIVQFEELEDDDEIRKFFGISSQANTLEEDLNANGYKPFASITTTRKKYKKGELFFVIDSTNFDFTILEIELMVDSESEIKKAEEKILAFADPYSSWQRGTNEYHNGLLRRYLPKGTSFVDLTQEELDDIVWEINNRPRKVLNFNTPQEVFNSYLGGRIQD